MSKVRYTLVVLLSLMLLFTSCSSTERIEEVEPAPVFVETPAEEALVEAEAELDAADVESTPSDMVSGTISEVSRYGNIYIDVLVSDLPFKVGDIVYIVAGGETVVAPVVTNYSDVNNGEALVKVDGEYTEIALSYASFANTYGVGVGDELVVALLEEGGYLGEYEIRHLERSDNREDYASDEIFANFRPLSGGNMKEYFIYRSCNPALGDARAEYADHLADMVGIQTVINLADTEETLLETIDPNSYYANLYENGRVILLGMGVDFRQPDFRAKLKEGLLFILDNPIDPFLIHCNEGKDRAGMVAALLEALAGASMDEIVADYMTSYENYYGVEKGTEQYDAIASIIKDFFTTINGRPFPEDGVKQVAEVYLTTQVGLTGDQVAQLEALITE